MIPKSLSQLSVVLVLAFLSSNCLFLPLAYLVTFNLNTEMTYQAIAMDVNRPLLWSVISLEIRLCLLFALALRTREFSFLVCHCFPLQWSLGFPSKFFLNRVSLLQLSHSSVQFSSVVQSCPTPCDSMNRSMSGLPVHH